MPEQLPTLADVCSAIAEGRLAVNSDGATYQVNAFELRRYFKKASAFPSDLLLETLSAIDARAREHTYHELSCGLGQ